MKEAQDRSAWLIRRLLVGAVLLMLAGCATGSRFGGEESMPAKVVRLKGAARWSSDDGKTWREIKVGSQLPPGALVQTAANSRIHVRLGEPALRIAHAGSNEITLYDRNRTSDNIMRLWEDSLLRLDQLTRRLTKLGTHIVEEMRFDLRAGHVFVHLTELADDSQYEIKFPKGVVRIRSGVYDIDGDGVVKVLVGKASVIVTGSSGTQEVLAGQVFDARTGVRDSLRSYLDR